MQQDRRILLEICVDSLSSALAAEQAGADRLELCAALSEGGLTPSAALIRQVCRATRLPVMLMIRPRGGSFVYDAQEICVMCEDIDHALDTGAAGFVFGALDAQLRLDVATCRRLLECAQGRECTFHRAFDVCVSAHTALEQLVELGFARLLTSGQAPTAAQGAARIAQWVTQAKGRIRVMAGAGVTPENVRQLVAATGVGEVHGSASTWQTDAPSLPTGSADAAGRRRVTSRQIAAQLRRALDDDPSLRRPRPGDAADEES